MREIKELCCFYIPSVSEKVSSVLYPGECEDWKCPTNVLLTPCLGEESLKNTDTLGMCLKFGTPPSLLETTAVHWKQTYFCSTSQPKAYYEQTHNTQHTHNIL